MFRHLDFNEVHFHIVVYEIFKYRKSFIKSLLTKHEYCLMNLYSK